MSNDINGLDVHDEGLKGIFGSRFSDGTESSQSREAEKASNQPAPIAKSVRSAAWKTLNISVDDVPTDLRKSDDYLPDKMWAVAKKSLLFAGISWLVFYWQLAGLMAESIAVPCMWVCAVMAGWGAGKEMSGK